MATDPHMTSAQFIADTNKEIHDIKHELRNLSAKQMQVVDLNEKNARDTANRIAELSAKVTLLHESSLASGHPEKIRRLEEFMNAFLAITNLKDYESMNAENKLNTKFRTQWAWLFGGIIGTLSIIASILSIIKFAR